MSWTIGAEPFDKILIEKPILCMGWMANMTFWLEHQYFYQKSVQNKSEMKHRKLFD